MEPRKDRQCGRFCLVFPFSLFFLCVSRCVLVDAFQTKNTTADLSVPFELSAESMTTESGVTSHGRQSQKLFPEDQSTVTYSKHPATRAPTKPSHSSAAEEAIPFKLKQYKSINVTDSTQTPLADISSSGSTPFSNKESNTISAAESVESSLPGHTFSTPEAEPISPDELIIGTTNFQVNFTSSTSGQIQHSVWENMTRSGNSGLMAFQFGVSALYESVRINIPKDYMLMVSVPMISMDDMSCSFFNGLTLKVDGRIMWMTCKNVHPQTRLYTASEFLFEFDTNGIEPIPISFRLLFSFHSVSAPPRQLEDGTWNCSTPHWPDFRQHLRCNVEIECAGGEDEADCDYHSDACGPDRLSAAGGCYSFTQPDRSLGWDEASDLCQGQGGQLVSLNTHEEWRAVSELLSRFNFEAIFLGLSGRNPVRLSTYRNILTWSDGSIAYLRYIDENANSGQYFYIRQEDFKAGSDILISMAGDGIPEITKQRTNGIFIDSAYDWVSSNVDTFTVRTSKGFQKPKPKPVLNILCEFQKESSVPEAMQVGVLLPIVNAAQYVVPMVHCPDGHVTRTFLACDVSSKCWSRGYGSAYSCDAPLTPVPPSFTCANDVEHVPFTLVCDHRPDCSDDSDEDFCVFAPCDGVGVMYCGEGQCLPFRLRCDSIEDCANGADEQWCMTKFQQHSTSPPPAAVYLDGKGSFLVDSLPSDVTSCPVDTFQCHSAYYCLPVYMRCNGLYDCPGREDEVGCDSYTCPGFYRCRDSLICLHPNFICDGLHQCPHQDDEFLCDVSCPEQCVCHGLAAYCDSAFPAHGFPELRYLEAAGSGMTLPEVSNNSMLVHLGLARCHLRQVDSPLLPNLRYLDLSDNHLTAVSGHDLNQLPNLKTLVLDGNPMISTFLVDADAVIGFHSLTVLRLSRVVIKDFQASLLTVFQNLQILNLSDSEVNQLTGDGFKLLKELEVLDVTGCPLTSFPRDVIRDLINLERVAADNYKLCCPATLPEGFNLANCHAPSDEISSCDALLRSDVYRVVLSVFAALALIGNLGSFVYRVVISKVRSRLGYGVFVTHLSVSDFLMGVYLAIIGVADRVYSGTYLWDDVVWKHSVTCRVAGFLSLLSSEVSALIICFITLDRFLVLRFPFGRIHFRKMSAHVACGGVWSLGVVLAGIPLLPMTSHWQFYGQNGICIPLPITRNSFSGHDYSFSVMIIFNFVLFLAIAAGQIIIYWTVKKNSMADGSSNKASNDLAIAQRLLTVAVTDFLCWFPIGLLGLLASTGTPIPGEVNVTMAILVLPLNSALNPFLYTLNMILERRAKEKEKRLQQVILAAHNSQTTKTSSAAK